MKSAEEWAVIITPLRSDAKYSDQIKQIQLDAIKHGMTMAADLSKTYKVAESMAHKNHGDVWNEATDSVSRAIANTRDNLKEIPTK